MDNSITLINLKNTMKTFLQKKMGVTIAFMLLSALSSSLYAYDVIVAKDGTGNFTTVQAAINAAPTGRTMPYTIFIKNGKYREKDTIPASKPFIQLLYVTLNEILQTFKHP